MLGQASTRPREVRQLPQRQTHPRKEAQGQAACRAQGQSRHLLPTCSLLHQEGLRQKEAASHDGLQELQAMCVPYHL